MKEFIKIGDHYVKDAQAREELEGIKTEMEGVKESLNNIPTPSNPLPAVSEADNGKVLGVVNGVWGKMDIPTETWTLTFEDDSTVTKKVCVV